MLSTRLTQALSLRFPIVSAPMAMVGGGRLAAAVSTGGGLGLIGGGYCDADWITTEFDRAENAGIGIGFITWRLARQPDLLEACLARKPRAVFLSFGDPAPFGDRIRNAGARMICQVQSLHDAEVAVAAGADILVAQGSEAGGHSANRATMTLVPEIADWVAAKAPETLVLAAGGIADGRGLAAALMLGADGVVCGTRFWAADEALAPPGHHAMGLNAVGDDTIQTKVADIARGYDWPDRFAIRVLRNAFTDRWHHDIAGLKADASARADWLRAAADGRTETASATVGEGIGLIHSIRPAATILSDMAEQAEALLAGGWKK